MDFKIKIIRNAFQLSYHLLNLCWWIFVLCLNQNRLNFVVFRFWVVKANQTKRNEKNRHTYEMPWAGDSISNSNFKLEKEKMCGHEKKRSTQSPCAALRSWKNYNEIKHTQHFTHNKREKKFVTWHSDRASEWAGANDRTNRQANERARSAHICVHESVFASLVSRWFVCAVCLPVGSAKNKNTTQLRE